jgi:DNA polymerase III subunit chi
MTDIEFHVNVPDKLQYGCRLLRKAYRSGAKAIVTAEPELLKQLDQLLWTFSSTEVLPHCVSTAPIHVLAATPILLAESLQTCPADSVLINMGQHPPLEFERFQRFIEVASVQPEDLLAARVRWKHYKDRGYTLKRHELTATTCAA